MFQFRNPDTIFVISAVWHWIAFKLNHFNFHSDCGTFFSKHTPCTVLDSFLYEYPTYTDVAASLCDCISPQILHGSLANALMIASTIAFGNPRCIRSISALPPSHFLSSVSTTQILAPGKFPPSPVGQPHLKTWCRENSASNSLLCPPFSKAQKAFRLVGIH